MDQQVFEGLCFVWSRCVSHATHPHFPESADTHSDSTTRANVAGACSSPVLVDLFLATVRAEAALHRVVDVQDEPGHEGTACVVQGADNRASLDVSHRR